MALNLDVVATCSSSIRFPLCAPELVHPERLEASRNWVLPMTRACFRQDDLGIGHRPRISCSGPKQSHSSRRGAYPSGSHSTLRF
jgi:hypothetical protein